MPRRGLLLILMEFLCPISWNNRIRKYSLCASLVTDANLIITMTPQGRYHKYSLLSNLFGVWVAKLDNKGYHAIQINSIPDFQTDVVGIQTGRGLFKFIQFLNLNTKDIYFILFTHKETEARESETICHAASKLWMLNLGLESKVMGLLIYCDMLSFTRVLGESQ